MIPSLEDFGIKTADALISQTKIVFVLKSGIKTEVQTPLLSKDVITLWNTNGKIFKIPTGKDSYLIVKKKSVDFLTAFPL